MPGRAENLAGTVTFVVTLGSSSLDYYAQKLAEQLPVRTIRTDVYPCSTEIWNVSFASGDAARAALRDAAFVRLLRATDGVVHLPNHHFGRYGRFLSGPYVITVHDLMRYRDMWRPEPLIHTPNRRDRVLLRLDAAGIRRAPAIIAVSETTKREIVDQLGVPDERVTVVHNGVDHDIFRPVVGRPLEEPYLLYVGSEQPRKEFPTLLRAVACLKREPRFRDLKLVKVGDPGGPEVPYRERVLRVVRGLGLEDDVVFAGRVDARDLAVYYSAAECFALPSRHEGFGLTPVEAMACGCPVVASRAGALPEVTGSNALLVEPGDDDALARAIARIMTDPATANELRERGLEWARHFSWERTARETLAVYERVRAQAVAA